MRHKSGIGIIFLCLATQVHSVLEIDRKNTLDIDKLVKKTCTMFVEVKHQWSAETKPYIDKGSRAWR